MMPGPHSAPSACLSPTKKAELNRAVSEIDGWMSTYQLPPFDGSGGIGGPMATYWASSPYVSGPYIMNSYGLIRGLCARAADDHDGSARLQAEQLGLYYLRSQDPTTGIVVCSWGEEPFVPSGLVQQASVVAALRDLHRVWPNPDLAQAADRCWHACLNHPLLKSGWVVHNQALRGIEALGLEIVARGDSRPNAFERALLDLVGRQVAQAQWQGETEVSGALAQSLADDTVIMPYQGKCLVPLITLAEMLNDDKYLEIARRLANFILQNLKKKEAGRIRGQYLAQGLDLKQRRRWYRLRRLFPFLEPVLRHHRQTRITEWRFYEWPEWIARGLDTARGLYQLGQTLGEELYLEASMVMVQEALRHQTPLGGIRNTFGFFGDSPESSGGLVWQDVAAIPRWNSYAAQFLHELAAGLPVLPPTRLNDEVRDDIRLAGNFRLIETNNELQMVKPDGDIGWHLRKVQRWGQPFRPIPQWNEGAVATCSILAT